MLSDHSIERAPQSDGVLRLHVKEGYFFTPPKRVTSPTWGPPPPCKQALSPNSDQHQFSPGNISTLSIETVMTFDKMIT